MLPQSQFPPPSPASPTTPSPSSQVGFRWNPGFSISGSTTQDGSTETVDTPPRYGGARDVILVRGASASTAATSDYPSPSSSPASSRSPRSTRSSVMTEYSPVEATSSVKSLPASPYSVNPPSPSRPSPSATIILSPTLSPLPRPLPPPTIGRMPINGEIRMLVPPNRCLASLANYFLSRWYRAKKDYYEKALRDLDIARIGGRGASEVQMTTRNGTEIVHRGNIHEPFATILRFIIHISNRMWKFDWHGHNHSPPARRSPHTCSKSRPSHKLSNQVQRAA